MRYRRKAIIYIGCIIIYLLSNLFLEEITSIGKAYGRETSSNNLVEKNTAAKLVAYKELPGNIKAVKNVKTTKNQMTLVQDVNISIYQNERDFLPKTVKAKYSDGKTYEVKVTWEENIIDTSKTGKYTVEGSIDGYAGKVKCTVNIKPLEDIINELILLPEDSYDKTESDRMIGRISRIYPGILNGLLKRNIHIKLINTPITYLPEYSYLRGMIPRGWENTGKTWDDIPGVSGNPIAIRIGYSEPGKGHGSINLELHETAHTIDSYLFKGITSTKEFRDIWKREVESLFGENSYFLSYPDEYFAEAFAMFYLDNEHKYELSYKAPLTFKFIENLEMAVK